MHRYLRSILLLGLALALLACMASVAAARVSYTTSKPAVSNAPKKDRPFVTSGYITPKSTASNRATVKIILWMKYWTAGASWTRTGPSSRRGTPRAPSTRSPSTSR